MRRTTQPSLERKSLYLWLLTTMVIFLLSFFGRKLQRFIVARIDEQWIAVVVFIVLIGVLLTFLVKAPKRSKPHWTILFFATLIISGGFAVYMKYLMPVEAVHFCLFTFFGYLSGSAFGPLYAVAAILTVSCGDELLQHFLADRVGDMHDVVINLFSSITGLLLRAGR